MSTTNSDRTTCKSWEHDFVVKKQTMSARTGEADISEVFCRKCGTVCILSQPRVATITN